MSPTNGLQYHASAPMLKNSDICVTDRCSTSLRRPWRGSSITSGCASVVEKNPTASTVASRRRSSGVPFSAFWAWRLWSIVLAPRLKLPQFNRLGSYALIFFDLANPTERVCLDRAYAHKFRQACQWLQPRSRPNTLCDRYHALVGSRRPGWVESKPTRPQW